MARFEWAKLLSPQRFSDIDGSAPPELPPASWQVAMRTDTERDYDRILFAAPTRRMADKTQVFPLDPNTSIRTRLTHSHEVSNIARSIGLHLVHTFFSERVAAEAMPAHYMRDIPAMLAAIGLVHDIGNPPFGHSGEDAISGWFKNRAEQDTTFGAQFAALDRPDDFLKFEGNAQTLRLLTKLQVATKSYGLNLTMGTLAAAMKYTVGSDQTSPARAASKKYGFFLTEQETATRVLAAAGLEAGQRHPLAVIMEACDDIAYTVLDTEDAVKKQLVSFTDLITYLGRFDDPLVHDVIDRAVADHARHETEQDGIALSPSELNDVSMQRFRTYAINAMVSHVFHAFVAHYEDIMQNRFTGELIAHSGAATLRDALKSFDAIHAYGHKTTLKLQLEGTNTLQGLMDCLWEGILYHGQQQGERQAFADYAYSRISENHRRQFARATSVPLFYRQCRLLTDMASGMADSYSISLYQELKALKTV